MNNVTGVFKVYSPRRFSLLVACCCFLANHNLSLKETQKLVFDSDVLLSGRIRLSEITCNRMLAKTAKALGTCRFWTKIPTFKRVQHFPGKY